LGDGIGDSIVNFELKLMTKRRLLRLNDKRRNHETYYLYNR